MSPVNTTTSFSDSDDPLSYLTRPPSDETPQDRQRRLAQEAQDRKISDGIDEMLKQEAKRKKNRDRREIKVLLLGQSESGKSTCIKQFQILYSPASFASERESWKAVVYLNLVKSVRKILDTICEPPPGEDPSSDDNENDDFGAPTPWKQPRNRAHQEAVQSIAQRSATPISFGVRQPMDAPDSPPVRDSEDGSYSQFAAIRLRLSPLSLAEDLLIRRLSGPEGEEEPSSFGTWNSVDPSGEISGGGSNKASSGNARIKEVFVRSGSNWKGLFSGKDGKNGRKENGDGRRLPPQHDPFLLVSACKDDMLALWRDPAVQAILRKNSIRLEEMPGFYLNDLPRVTAPNYIPSTQDVLNARLKTLGVVEHLFQLETGGSSEGGDWRIYDVGGHRDQRHTWAPFFDDVNAIIFLAPISAFDQVLLEDKRLNRIEDSLLLFRSICANKLLGKNIVLFLNKIDILKSKLEAGIKVNKFVRSYGERPNTFEHVSRYFLSKFVAVHKESSPVAGRELFTHMTAVTNTETTKAIIGNVRESILRKHLEKSALM